MEGREATNKNHFPENSRIRLYTANGSGGGVGKKREGTLSGARELTKKSVYIAAIQNENGYDCREREDGD